LGDVRVVWILDVSNRLDDVRRAVGVGVVALHDGSVVLLRDREFRRVERDLTLGVFRAVIGTASGDESHTRQ